VYVYIVTKLFGHDGKGRVGDLFLAMHASQALRVETRIQRDNDQGNYTVLVILHTPAR